MDKHTHQDKTPDCCGEAMNSAQSEVEKLKAEILKELAPVAKEKLNIPWGSMIVTIVLGILALVSVAQAAQSVAILKKLQSGDLKAATTDAGGASSLPNMVGGC